MCVCVLSLFFVDFIRCPTRSTLFPYTTLFRSQYESEVVYHQINEELERQGVIFMDTDTALREHPEFFEEYFGTVIPAGDNKFAALHTAVWAGGSFVDVPPGLHVELPLPAYFATDLEDVG